MRGTFASTLGELAERDSRIMLLTADLGYAALEPFSERFPDRFLNCGVAEQNMLGVATGLADGGFLPFVYSIGTFGVLRAYEFIRNGPVLQRMPVRIVGVGAGFEYGTAGPTHHVLEDIAVLRCLPGLRIVVPADHRQARQALLATWDDPGPVYFRLSKDDVSTIPGFDGRFDPAGPNWLRRGEELLLVTMGTIAKDVLEAAERLGRKGVAAAVLLVSSFQPQSDAALGRIVAEYGRIVVVEAHSINGGLGSLVCELAAEAGRAACVRRCGVRGMSAVTGQESYLKHVHGLDADGIESSALGLLEGRPL